MAIRTTTWRPDTCGCELAYDWDDSLPEGERIHDNARLVKTCAAHETVEDGIEQGRFKGDGKALAVCEENLRKNKAVSDIIVATGVTDEQERSLLAQSITFEFDEKRDLTLTVPSELMQTKGPEITSALAKHGKKVAVK